MFLLVDQLDSILLIAMVKFFHHVSVSKAFSSCRQACQQAGFFFSPLGALRTLEESLLSHHLDKKKEKKRKKIILVAALKMQSS